MKEIDKFLRRNKKYNVKIAVVGDTMIDEYYSVCADRVSPEFPIPVMQRDDGNPTSYCPGGAGNVCGQFKHFNVDVRHFAFADSYTAKVLEEFGISSAYCANLTGANKTPRKKRFYHGDFPLCRLDIEAKNYGLDDAALRAKQEELFSTFVNSEKDVIILSDYGKGLFSGGHETKFWVQKTEDEIPTIVDPKGGPISRWKGCTVIKPNEKEAEALSGEKDWRKQCTYFLRETECLAVVITQGGTGVVGNVMGREFEYRPRQTVKANSVIGAGDCFVAFLAMGLAHAIDIIDVVEIAFEAGAKYVQRKHNQPIAIEDLLGPCQVKFVSPENLANRNFTLSVTNGVFDLLHSGHLSTIQFAKTKAEKLAVLVNTDESVKRLKGDKRPIVPLKERMEMLAALEVVDFVVPFNELTPLQAIRQIQPDCLIKGADYRDKEVVGTNVVGEANVFYAPILDGFSTSTVIDKIKKDC
ncbi:MAG: PfkB family carbohydrate kinase [Candidatus Hermodarchaeia archaeon]|jgi:D-beta-D-heptose 7-phosphate kinase/D-beta-D-heptose 1-phosphate adenosyltransferase